jgi:hypothetical protein
MTSGGVTAKGLNSYNISNIPVSGNGIRANVDTYSLAIHSKGGYNLENQTSGPSIRQL